MPPEEASCSTQQQAAQSSLPPQTPHSQRIEALPGAEDAAGGVLLEVVGEAEPAGNENHGATAGDPIGELPGGGDDVESPPHRAYISSLNWKIDPLKAFPASLLPPTLYHLEAGQPDPKAN